METEELLSTPASQGQPETHLPALAPPEGEMTPADGPPLPRRPVEQDAPLSFAQTALWFLQQLAPESSAYQECLALSLRGVLQVEALVQAIRQMMERHEVLRSTFPLREGQVVQVSDRHQQFSVPLSDLSHLSAEERETAVRARISEESQRPFDLTGERPWRCVLLRVQEREHVLLIILHRMISDEWSSRLFARELGVLYAALAAGHPSPLSDLPIQYADYAHWQRQRLQGEILEEQLAYWKQRLAGAPAALSLPTDYPRPAQRKQHGASQTFILSRQLTEALKALGQSERVTPFMLLLAAFQALLYRYSGQEDISVGFPVANRTRAETRDLIGLFANTLVLRSIFSENLTFRDLLEQVRQATLEVYAHQDLPFEKLVEELNPERDLSRTPLFQAMFIWQDAPPPPLELPGLTLTSREIASASAQFDVTLTLVEKPEGLSGVITYATDLFEAATIARMVGHWRTLLEAVVVNPNLRLVDLPLLTERERQQILVEWNATTRDYGQEDLLIHQIFERQAQRTPDAIAVVCNGEQLTYHALNQQANQFARLLIEQGVGPDVLVGVLAERGIPFLTAILAIFKAGGAFLPLDPQHPARRISQVLSQSGSSLVLTSPEFDQTLEKALSDMPLQGRPQILHLKALLRQERSRDDLPACCLSGHLAYVMYTSGSTGTPKGAMVEQLGMLNHIYGKIEDLQMTAADTVAQNGPQCFDIYVWQCLAALVVGGRVHIFTDEIAHDPTRLLHAIKDHQILILQVVPSMLRSVIQEAEALDGAHPPLPTLRWMVPTGDALTAELCRQWLKLYPQIPLLNTYGSTECSDDQCHYPIYQPPPPEYPLAVMPIGRPIGNMRAYVLDRTLSPVPVGIVGELYIGGIGVGRGYLNDVQRTDEVFVADPFGPEPGMRLYKTRDLARYLPDGTLEFLGRVDHLVKVRGFRIELGEIETALEQHSAVQEALVLVTEDATVNKRLLAFVVPSSRSQGSNAGNALGGREQEQQTNLVVDELAPQLRRFLRERLPEYMLPSAFVFLEAMPLTANGKVDRKALPVPDPGERLTKDSFVAPTLFLHHQLVRIWEELVEVRPIGITDDFFELGGHSLLAVRLVKRIEQVCGKKLPLSTLFAGATIAHLATALTGNAETETDSRAPLVAVQVSGSRRPFFFLHGQWEGGAFYSLELARALGPDQPFYLLEPYQFAGLAVLPTFEAMAAAHLKALRSVQPEGPYLLGGWCNGALIAYEMARQLRAEGQAVDLLVLMDADAPTASQKRDRRIISGFGKLLRRNQEKQVDWFLSYRYLRLSFYYWRLNKLKQRRTGKQNEPGSEQSSADAQLADIMPAKEVFRQDWSSIYDWVAMGYAPGSYAGKITFFWTSEEPFRSEGWRKAMEAKTEANAAEIHIIPGDHITSRTQYLPVLAEHLRSCLSKAQAILSS